MKLITLFILLTLCACGTVKPKGTYTEIGDQTYFSPAPVPMKDPTYTDGTPMDKEMLKEQYGWEPPPRDYIWGCYAADVGSTGAGLAMGMAEANPLGLVTLPIAIAGGIYAKKEADAGNFHTARIYEVVHCGAFALNMIGILLFIL